MRRIRNNDRCPLHSGTPPRPLRRSFVSDINLRLRGGAIRPAGGRSSSGARAFTLVEVAMSVIVLALALTTSLAAMQRAFLQFDTARNLEIAAGILQCEMEKERLFGWSQLNDPTYRPAIDPSFARNSKIAGRFTLSRTLEMLPGRDEQMAQITLTIRWRSFDGRSLSRSYTTYYTEGGLHAYLYQP